MNTDILIVGGDGDLALRKLYPAFYYLTLNGCMPENTRIFGMARSHNEQDAFLAKVKEWLKENTGALYDDAIWAQFSQRLTFVQGDSTKAEDLERIKNTHFGDDRDLIVYLAVPPLIFGKICTALEKCGLAKPTTRLVVEKPLGDSKESFMAINNELSRVFSEKQLYRIDHYLGKESVQNLLALRFANDIFEPIWNSKHIDHIQISVTETVGCGNRWDFYDQTGAMRDMIQNHLLQVLCLVCMEPPINLDADSVRTEKLKILSCLKPMSDQDIENYPMPGEDGSTFIIRDDVGDAAQLEAVAKIMLQDVRILRVIRPGDQFLPDGSRAPLLAALDAGLHGLLFASGSAVRGLVRLLLAGRFRGVKLCAGTG